MIFLVRESILVLSLCALGEMLTGTFLEAGLSIKYLPGLLILVPAILEMRGTISGSFSSRISTALHIGTVKPRLKYNTKYFRANIRANLFLLVMTPLIAASVSSLLCSILNVKNIGFFGLLFIALVAGSFSGIIQLFVTIASGFMIFNRGFDPDIIVYPILSIIGDVLSVISLMLAAQLYIFLFNLGGFPLIGLEVLG